MFKASATLAVLCLLSLPALARPQIVATSYVPPINGSCDLRDGFFAATGVDRKRDCYVPFYGPDPQTFGPFRQSGAGAFAPVPITVNQPTVVKVTYRQSIFLNSELPNGCQPGLPSCAGYIASVGVGGTAPSQVCWPGGQPDGLAFGSGPSTVALGIKGFDFLAAGGDSVEALCVAVIPAGTTLVYPVEVARAGVFGFAGFLMVEYDDGT